MPGSFDSSAEKDTHAAHADVTETTERARRDLERLGREVSDLERALEPLAQSSAAVAGIASQVSTLVITLAGEITRAGTAGQPFVPCLEQLAKIGRTSFEALKELQRHANDGRARARTLLAVAEQSRDTIERLAPAVTSLAQAQATRAQGPAVMMVPEPAPASDKAARVAQLTDEVIRTRAQRTSGPKN
jgi:hypothetical protein